MRKLALTLTAALVVGGCTSETGVVQDVARITAKSPANGISPVVAKVGRTASFASMPDRGALLAFKPGQLPVRRQAHTYHAVQLSESHALNAAAPGKFIDLPTPSGKTLRIAYQRHEESVDGNWSWIGRTADGLEAVFTFGEKAVFGRIAQQDTEALRVMTSAGSAWLVETDPSKLYDGNLLRDPDASDMLVPQSVAAAVLANKRAKAVTSAGDQAAGAADTVDIVLGYTNGLVTKYGGVSQTTTRLSYLTALTNLGYQNSLVTGRVRLVHTLQVNYTDTNSNELALEALTGQACNPTCAPQTVPAELVPLRNARDQYGGDLVSLVRPFQAPQHQGCGIAWLLGGGGVTIDNSDAPFGYSVVSDGNDTDETDGRNYFCREETLAHELGHNMGQQHNTEDSGGDSGTHPYSYGYREASSTGFYTIMAYRLANSSQFAVNHFGNPSVNYSGRPTGTATADNARSLNISIPLVAQFRASVVPFVGGARGDLNGDGRSDIVWRNSSQGQMAYWLQNGPTRIGSGSASVVSTSSIVGLGDFDGDGRADQLWNSSTNNHLWLYRSRSDGGFDYQFVDFYPAGWAVVGVTDLNADGKADIVLRNETQGLMSYWLMNGATRVSSGAVSIAAGNTVVGTGDFDGDGRGDLLWTNNAGRLLWLYRSRSDGGFDYQPIDYYPTGWSVSGVTDVNGDGRADVIWRNTSTAQMSYWTMNGATRTGSGVATIAATSSIVGTGDFDGDGLGDLLWASSEGNFLWIYRSLGNGSFTYQFVDFFPSGWQVVNGGS